MRKFRSNTVLVAIMKIIIQGESDHPSTMFYWKTANRRNVK